MQGKIYKIISNFYYVKANDKLIECKAKGRFKNDCIDLLVGDNVKIEQIDNDKGNIVNVLPRKNKLKRPSVANVDKLIILLSIKSPNPDFLLLDKQIIYCVKNNILPIICITKIDKDESNAKDKIKKLYNMIGYNVYCISAKEKIGIDELKNELRNCLCVFSGNSGVGKSTLVNTMCNKDIMLQGNISAKTQRGKHTTRHIEIIQNDDIMIVDTPGFSLFDVSEINKNKLAYYFEEFLPYIDKCEFRDCTHIKEEKCAIKLATDSGLISNERYKRYMQIYNELHN